MGLRDNKIIRLYAGILWDGCLKMSGLSAIILGVYFVEGISCPKIIWIGITLLSVGFIVLFGSTVYDLLSLLYTWGHKWWVEIKGESIPLEKHIKEIEIEALGGKG